MCLLFLYVNPRPKVGEYKVIIVNNRDEYYTRPTKPAHFWDDRIVGGMDAEEQRGGGTWLAVSKVGKISCLLNVLQPASYFEGNKAGRGFLVVDYLKSEQKGHQYMEDVKNLGKMYNPFNLITLDPEGDSYDATFYNDQDKIIQKLQPGCHGFGNCPRTKPFKKVQKGEVMFQDLVKAHGNKECEEKLIAELFLMMQNRDYNFPDAQLTEQGTGYAENNIYRLSSIWVSCPAAKYGSRTTTVILVDHNNQVVFREQTMLDPVNPENPEWKMSNFTFTVTPNS